MILKQECSLLFRSVHVWHAQPCRTTASITIQSSSHVPTQVVNMCFEIHTSILIANTAQRLESTNINNEHKNRRTPILCTRDFWVGLWLTSTGLLLWSSGPASITASYVGVIPSQSWFVWSSELCITFTLTAEIYCSSCAEDERTHTTVCAPRLKGQWTYHDSYISFPPPEVFISLVCYL